MIRRYLGSIVVALGLRVWVLLVCLVVLVTLLVVIEHAHLHHVLQNLLLLTQVLGHGTGVLHVWHCTGVLVHHHLHEQSLVLLRELHLVVWLIHHLLLHLLHVEIVWHAGKRWHSSHVLATHVVLAHLVHLVSLTGAVVHTEVLLTVWRIVEVTSTTVHVDAVWVVDESALVSVFTVAL